MSTSASYIYWLRDMADREEMSIRPCPKTLRRAADCFEELQAQLEDVTETLMPYAEGYPESTPNAVGQPVSTEPQPADIAEYAIKELETSVDTWSKAYYEATNRIDELVAQLLASRKHSLAETTTKHTLQARIDKACDELERLRDEPEPEIPIPDNLPQIDDILFDLEGGEEGFSLELEKS